MLHTNARTDAELLKVWLKSHRDGSPHTVRVYTRVGQRFLAGLTSLGVDLRRPRSRMFRLRSSPCAARPTARR
jgi:hypothetical protein